MTPLTALEKKMLKALNDQEDTSFKPNQLMEWSTTEVKPEAGEKVFKVKEYSVYIAIKLEEESK